MMFKPIPGPPETTAVEPYWVLYCANAPNCVPGYMYPTESAAHEAARKCASKWPRALISVARVDSEVVVKYRKHE